MDAIMIKTLNRKTSLKEMREYIGGYVEIVYLPKDKTNMVMDSDGRLKALPINEKASEIWRANFGAYSYTQIIVGKVIILKGEAILRRK
jgi:hypothetical protein